jgi:hypothetical protein
MKTSRYGPNKRLLLAFHKETGIPNGDINDYQIERANNPTGHRYDSYYTEYLDYEMREVPIWYDVMAFCKEMPEEILCPEKYGGSRRPRMQNWGKKSRIFVQSRHFYSPYYEQYFRVMGPQLRHMLSGGVGSFKVIDGKVAGDWTFTRIGSQVGVRYLGEREETLIKDEEEKDNDTGTICTSIRASAFTQKDVNSRSRALREEGC